MKKIVIADHHPLMAAGIGFLLENTSEFQIVGVVENRTELFHILEKTHPDLLILELNMPEIRGFHAIRNIHEEFPRIKIAIFSSHPEEIYALRSIKSGAAGFIQKSASKEEFLHAIKKIAMGGVYLNEKLNIGRKGKSSRENSIFARYKKLSSREIEVLNLLYVGKRNKDIASLLELNEKTVSTYKTRLLKKLNMKTLAELISQTNMLQFR